jgi:predicted ArsR family transcriptional regulator
VDAQSVAAGVALVRWFGEEARRVYATLGETDEDRDARRLVEWIERKGGTVTVRDLTRGPREYRNDPERAREALSKLVAAGVGRWEVDDHAGGRGRPADRFRLLSRGGDTGDGDTNSNNAEDHGISVAVATVASPTDAGDGWGEDAA